jgi:dipeptidase E
MRIAEYHAVNANPVVGIEEGTLLRVEEGVVTVLGRGRARLFERGREPRGYRAGERFPAA